MSQVAHAFTNIFFLFFLLQNCNCNYRSKENKKIFLQTIATTGSGAEDTYVSPSDQAKKIVLEYDIPDDVLSKLIEKHKNTVDMPDWTTIVIRLSALVLSSEHVAVDDASKCRKLLQQHQFASKQIQEWIFQCKHSKTGNIDYAHLLMLVSAHIAA